MEKKPVGQQVYDYLGSKETQDLIQRLEWNVIQVDRSTGRLIWPIKQN